MRSSCPPAVCGPDSSFIDDPPALSGAWLVRSAPQNHTRLESVKRRMPTLLEAAASESDAVDYVVFSCYTIKSSVLSTGDVLVGVHLIDSGPSGGLCASGLCPARKLFWIPSVREVPRERAKTAGPLRRRSSEVHPPSEGPLFPAAIELTTLFASDFPMSAMRPRRRRRTPGRHRQSTTDDGGGLLVAER